MERQPTATTLLWISVALLGLGALLWPFFPEVEVFIRNLSNHIETMIGERGIV